MVELLLGALHGRVASHYMVGLLARCTAWYRVDSALHGRVANHLHGRVASHYMVGLLAVRLIICKKC